MCGITGFVDFRKSIDKQHLLKATEALRHRGGDGCGVVFENLDNYTIGIANERLATIDSKNSNANQPLISSCNNYIITFNGTIYNYNEIRIELQKKGVIFKTNSDTEVLLECYIHWNDTLFEKINGVFAFTIYDKRNQQLIIARDTLGVKPLYFYKDEHFFAFASEIKALLNYPITKQINTNALKNYFRYGYFIEESSIFNNIYKFEKQHFLIIDLRTKKYTKAKFSNHSSPIDIAKNEDDIIKNVNQLITKSVLQRSVTDSKFAVLLSGGYDSSCAAAILQKHHQQPINTYTLGFHQQNFDEAPIARNIAKHLNTNHHEFYIDDKGAINILEKMSSIFDEPMGDSGAIPLAYLVSQISKDNIKVLLGAEGGDELFAGYLNYEKALKINKFNKFTPSFFKSFVLNSLNNNKNKLAELFETKDLLSAYQVVCSYFSYQDLALLFNQDLSSQLIKKTSQNDLKALLEYDQNNYLSNDLLLKSDRIAMHFGIENRDAMLSTDLLNYTKLIDDKLIYKHKTLKYILKKITHQYVPKELLNKQKKGFSIPVVNWFLGIYKPYIDNYLTEEALNKHQLFNIEEVQKIKNRFYTTHQNADASKLWLLLQFQMWFKEHFN